jgi:hypothetical protein
MESLSLEYNSQRDKLVIPEYGRHIQKLIKHATQIEHDEERQQFTATVVDLMEQINPSNERGEEIKEKLWKHAVIISGYELDVKMPDGEPVRKEDALKKPAQLDYPQRDLKYRHYGSNIMNMIDKAVDIEDEDVRNDFAKVIGSCMKMAYKNWHKDHYASDEMIKSDLKSISKGKLDLGDNVSLDNGSGKRGRGRRSKKGRRGRGRSRKRRSK